MCHKNVRGKYSRNKFNNKKMNNNNSRWREKLDSGVRLIYVFFLNCLWVLQKVYNVILGLETFLAICPNKKPHQRKKDQNNINLMEVMRYKRKICQNPTKRKCSKNICVMTATEEAMIRCACAKGYTRKKNRHCIL